MPIISIFFGIIVRINFRDHNPPHLHAEHQGREALFDIRTGEVMEGRLPKRVIRDVQRWMRLHQDEIAENWKQAYIGEPTTKVAGLDQE